MFDQEWEPDIVPSGRMVSSSRFQRKATYTSVATGEVCISPGFCKKEIRKVFLNRMELKSYWGAANATSWIQEKSWMQ